MSGGGVGLDLQGAAALVVARGTALGRPMHLLASTTSSNDEAKRAARGGARSGAPHGATWVTEEQTAGRGRQGRTWWAPPGESLLFSVLLREAPPPSRLPQVALVAGLAVHDAVTRAAPGADVKIKWPNDVVVAGKKVAGVLVEAITTGARVDAVVVGIGINVHTRSFPGPIAERATSVVVIAGAGERPPDRAQILADALASLDRDLPFVVARGLVPLRGRLDAADGLRGLRVRTDGAEAVAGSFAGANEGVAEGIDEDGRLMVRRGDGVLDRWVAGEVHLVGGGSS